LLIGRDSFLVLNLGFDVFNRVTGLDFQRDGLASEGLDKDLHATSETEDQMERGFLLDVVIGKGPAVFQLLTRKDQPLLIRGNSFFILNLGLHILDGIAGLDFQSDGFSGESLDKDLHATSQSEHQVKG